MVNESSMRITDLVFDCLEKCLQHLSIAELLNVADANMHLRDAARQVFRRMLGQDSVAFMEVVKFRNGDARKCKCYYNETFDDFSFIPSSLIISEFKSSLRFLRCFGDLVTDMSFYFCTTDDCSSDSSRYCDSCLNIIALKNRAHEWEHRIIAYMNEFCCESLTSLTISGTDLSYVNCDLVKLTKPFANVETLETNIFFKIQNELHKLFPKVRELVMECPCPDYSYSKDTQISLHTDFMANRFPHLEHARIHIGEKYEFNKKHFAMALLSNPQIKTLAGNVWFEVLFDESNFYLWNANDNFQNLEKLDLVVDPYGNSELIRKTLSEEIHLRSLKELNIKFHRVKSYSKNVDITSTWNFPLTGDRLESLTISGVTSKFTQFSDLLYRYPTVKKFHFQFNKAFPHVRVLDRNDCSIISQALPLLEEILFVTTPTDVVDAIEMFRSLKYFHCSFLVPKRKGYIEFDRLVRSLKSWSLTKTIFRRIDRTVQLTVEGNRGT